MSDVRVEVVKLPRGKYGLRVIGADGPPIARVRPGASGIKQTIEQRRENRRAIQAALKAMYDRQQAAASQ